MKITDVKTALICGVSGQDGALLARLLLSKGYRVFGTSRDAQGTDFNNLKRLKIDKQIQILSMVPTDFRSVLVALQASEADEVYFLSGQSSVGLSFEQPALTIESIMLGTLNMLEACRMLEKSIRQYYAGSIECYGDTNCSVANETAALHPQSPYGVAKASALMLVDNYREAYGVFASTGILSNHESALRPNRFVTQKIVQGAKRIAAGSKEILELGRLDIVRDWGWAAEYVEPMWLMLQQDCPDDYLISTGHSRSLKDFANVAFSTLGLNWKEHVRQSEQLFRPTDILQSYTNPSKAREKLGWEAKTTMESVVVKMIEEDLS